MSEGLVELEAGRLWFERAGRGSAVILAHPGLWDSRIWDDQFDELAQEHDVVRYDRRGFGRSDEPKEPYSDLRDLQALLQELDVSRVAVVGCGSGARLAIDFALAEPDEMEAVVAVSPDLTGYRWQDPGYEALIDQVERAVQDGDLEGAVELQMAVWAPTTSRGDPRVRKIALENVGALTIDPALRETGPSALERLGEIRASTLVIAGDADVGEVLEIAERLASEIPGATRRVVADADQLVNVAKPEKFNRLVLDFLSFA